MADKPKTPSPPRKVQAPKVRQKASSSDSALPRNNILIGIGVVAIVGLVIALIVTVSGGKGSTENVTPAQIAEVKAAMTGAGCTFETKAADAANQHMSSADQKVDYETYPAASGAHNPTTAIWGNYRSAVDPRQAVHNLEHGGVAIWYGDEISAKDRGELDALYERDSRGMLISPLDEAFANVSYPKHEPLGSEIALTAWTADVGKPDSGKVHIAVCPSVDAAAFALFRDTFRGKGPERLPVSQMTSGSN
jgi:hypothetical protein